MRNSYFNWLCTFAGAKGVVYKKLLSYLFDTEFIFGIRMDGNRADDGIALRKRFVDNVGCSRISFDKTVNGPCSVLEMMIALSIRCQEDFLDNPEDEDDTSKIFWSMIHSLGLSDMCDRDYNIKLVKLIIKKFLKRQYRPNGKGGLFTIENTPYDLRNVEIWYQMLWYLDTIMEE